MADGRERGRPGPPTVEPSRPVAPAHGYEPPTVEWLGSLRDLLAKTGPVSDNSPQHPGRP